MTTEELLKIRWKVIADYPKSHYKIGDIVNGIYCEGLHLFSHYPAIFKRLSWWEGLSVDELPKYLKVREDAIRKVIKWDLPNGKVYVTNGFSDKPRYNNITIYIPATEEEYLQFTNQK